MSFRAALPAVASSVGRRLLREFNAADTPAAGMEIDGYRLIHRIGVGGMGEVWRAGQRSPRRSVALKLVRGDLLGPDPARRFELEAHALGRLNHDGIARIFNAGRDPATGRPYLVMEHVAGEPLHKWAAKASPPVAERVRVMIDLCHAVQHAHENGVYHRDLKPANVLVTPEGRPKVLDFGLARLADADPAWASVRTEPGLVLGTLAYMPPEQAAGDASASPAVPRAGDVYALGAILYELLGRRPPIDVAGLPLAAAVRRIVDDEPSRLSAADRGLRGDLETIVAKALEKEPARRYASAAAMAEDLRRHLSDEPIRARPPSAAYRTAKFARRNKAVVGGVLATFAVLLAGAVTSAGLALRATHHAAVADAQRSEAERQRSEAERQREAAEANAAEALRQTAAAHAQAAEAARRRGDAAAVRRHAGAAFATGHADDVPLRVMLLEFDSESDRAKALADYRALRARDDLGEHAGAVELLALSFEPDADPAAVVARARGLGLPPAKAALAEALDAPTLPGMIAHLDRSLAIDPYDAHAREMRMTAQAVMGQFADVADDARALAMLQPDSPLPHVVLAVLAMFDAPGLPTAALAGAPLPEATKARLAGPLEFVAGTFARGDPVGPADLAALVPKLVALQADPAFGGGGVGFLRVPMARSFTEARDRWVAMVPRLTFGVLPDDATLAELDRVQPSADVALLRLAGRLKSRGGMAGATAGDADLASAATTRPGIMTSVPRGRCELHAAAAAAAFVAWARARDRGQDGEAARLFAQARRHAGEALADPRWPDAFEQVATAAAVAGDAHAARTAAAVWRLTRPDEPGPLVLSAWVEARLAAGDPAAARRHLAAADALADGLAGDDRALRRETARLLGD